MKNIKMPDDAKKNHLKKFEKTGRKGHHGLESFDLRQKIDQNRKKQLIDAGEDKPMKEKKLYKKCKSQKYLLNFTKKYNQKKINVPCKFGDACKFKPNCWFLHQKRPTILVFKKY